MSTPIAEDFIAIRARMLSIRAAERSWTAAPPSEPQAPEEGPSPDAGPSDFYGWLMGAGLWGVARG